MWKVVLRAGVTVGASVIIVACGTEGSETLSADSSCRSFLEADPGSQQQAANRVGLDLGASDAGAPGFLQNVQALCANDSQRTLGGVIGTIPQGPDTLAEDPEVDCLDWSKVGSATDSYKLARDVAQREGLEGLADWVLLSKAVGERCEGNPERSLVDVLLELDRETGF